LAVFGLNFGLKVEDGSRRMAARASVKFKCLGVVIEREQKPSAKKPRRDLSRARRSSS
jgi:hypothetical protein